MESESGFAPPPALDRGLPAVLDELQWMLFRLFGVHSAVLLPGAGSPLPPWGWHRPLVCHNLHQLTSPDGRRTVQARCAAMAAALARAGGGDGRCAAGLTWRALPFRRAGRPAFSLVVGPYLAPADRPRRAIERVVAGPEALARANPRDFEGALARALPLAPAEERAMLRWCRMSFGAALRRRLARAPDAVWGSLASPLRYTGPAACSLYGIYVERVEGPPRPPPPGGLRSNGGELYVLEEGILRASRPGKTWRVTPGQGVFWLPGAPLALLPAGPERVAGTSVMVVGDLEAFRPLTARPITFTPAQRSALRDLLAAGLQAADEPAQASQRARLFDLLLSLLPARESRPDLPGGEPLYRRHHELLLVARVKERLWAAAERSITRRELAQAFHCSATHLNGIFRRHTGTSLLRYHRQLRMSRARSLLRGGRLNVSQVAARLGFSSIYHFSAEFKRATGQGPRAYARTARF
jgi:AraC-like DNA-binding protein